MKAGLLLAGLMFFGAAAVEARVLQTSTPAVPEQAAAPVAVITDGPTLFRERGCSQCHELKGVGGGAEEDKGPDLSGVGRRMKKDAIERQIVLGGGAMPAFGEALPHEEIAALVKYLQKCKDKQKPEVQHPLAPAAVTAPAAGPAS